MATGIRGAVVTLVVLGGTVLASCGGDDSASSRKDSPNRKTGCPPQLDPQHAATQWSPIANRLAVSAAQAIFTIDTDTCEVEKVTEGSDPDWSPDAQDLVFERDSGLFIVGADGSDVRQITAVADPDADSDSAPAWSPRGDLIAFLRRREPITDTVIFELMVVRPDGSGERLVESLGSPSSHERAKYQTAPAWSPDGHWIAWTECEWPNPRLSVCLVNLKGKKRRFTVSGPVTAQNVNAPSWSPDGKFIAFTRYDLGDEIERDPSPGRLMLVPAAGGHARPLLRQPPPSDSDGDFSPSWSPDSQWIAFVRRGRFGVETYVVRRDGSGLHRLTKASRDSAK